MMGYIFEGTTFLLQHRDDLFEEEHQARLRKAAAGPAKIYCAFCGDPPPRLVTFPIPGDLLDLKRGRVGVHLGGGERICSRSWDKCDGEFVATPEVRHPPTIFDPIAEIKAKGAGAKDENGSSDSDESKRYENFGHFFQKYFTRASLEAFAQKNLGKGYGSEGLQNATAVEIFDRVAEILLEPLMTGKDPCPATVLRNAKRELVFGVTDERLLDFKAEDLIENQAFFFEVGTYWSSEVTQGFGMGFDIPPRVAGAAAGKVKARGHDIAPPYLYAAVVQQMGLLSQAIRFYRVPVVLGDNYLFTHESNTEGRSLTVVGEAQLPCIKLPVDADLRILGPLLFPFKTDADGRLENRPDGIVFWGGLVHILFFSDAGDDLRWKKVGEDVDRMRKRLAHPDIRVQQLATDALTSENWRSLLV